MKTVYATSLYLLITCLTSVNGISIRHLNFDPTKSGNCISSFGFPEDTSLVPCSLSRPFILGADGKILLGPDKVKCLDASRGNVDDRVFVRPCSDDPQVAQKYNLKLFPGEGFEIRIKDESENPDDQEPECLGGFDDKNIRRTACGQDNVLWSIEADAS